LTVGRPKSDVLMDVAAGAGFAAVGMTLWVPGATLSPVCSDRGSQRRLRTRSETSGVSVADVGVVVFAPALDIRAATRLIEVAAALGAGRILVMDQDPVAERAAAGSPRARLMIDVLHLFPLGLLRPRSPRPRPAPDRGAIPETASCPWSRSFSPCRRTCR